MIVLELIGPDAILATTVRQGGFVPTLIGPIYEGALGGGFIIRTRAQMNTAASAGEITAGQGYIITDEGRLAVGTAATSYSAMALEGEGGGNSPDEPWTLTFSTPANSGYLGVIL